MGRKPGSRLAKRKAKREVAKATRTTKYADQKGGGGSNSAVAKQKRTGRRKGDRPLDSAVAVAAAQQQAEGGGEEGAQGCDDVKALRAFTKKLRMIEALKQRQRSGHTLDSAQLTKVKSEEYVLKQIIRLTSQPAGGGGEADGDEQELVVVRPHDLGARRR